MQSLLPPTEELKRVVEEAYDVFAPYTIGSALNVCPCPSCVSADSERRLVHTPLREIPAEFLAEYTNSAHPWNDGQVARETRYFLPRYFELLAANDPPDSMGLDICLRRLASARWHQGWPPGQADVIARFFDALVRGAMERLPVRHWTTGPDLAISMGSILTLIVTAGGDLERALGVWDGGSEVGAAAYMGQVRERLAYKRGRSFFASAHLEDHPEAADRIAAFVTRPGVDARIEAAFFLTSDPHLQTIFSRFG